MRNVFRRIIILAVCSLLFVVTISVVFFRGEMKNAEEIESVDLLTGQRIGVISAYEGDYLLTGRDDITLLRYDSEAECLLALSYKQVDAIAVVEDMAEYIMMVSTGLKTVEEPITYSGMATLFMKDGKFEEDFNEFVKEFRKTDEYQKYIEKVKNDAYYDGSEIIEETGTGEEIRLGYDELYLPVSFTDTKTGKPNGSEVEMFIYYANARNYRIKWEKITEATTAQAIASGTVDAVLIGYSDIYREETEMSTTVSMSDSYRETAVVLIEVEDYDNLSFGSLMEGEE